MKVLTAAETLDWLKSLGRNSQNNGDGGVAFDGKDIYFSDSDAACISLEYPPKLERLPAFARALATVGYEERDFNGALLWITQSGVWNPQDESPGYRTVEAFHSAAGQPSSFEAAKGHAFRADELVESVAMLLQPMIYGWDAYFIPNWTYGVGDFFLHVSHDSYVSVATRTEEFRETVNNQLRSFEFSFSPTAASEQARFCR